MAVVRRATGLEAPSLVITGTSATVSGSQVLTDLGTVAGTRRYRLALGSSGGTRRWVRLLTLDGQGASGGAQCSLLMSGTGDYGNTARGTVLLHVAQRGDNNISAKVWGFGVDLTQDPIEFWTRQISTFVFELWAYVADFNYTHDVHVLNNSFTTFNMDQIGITAPVAPIVQHPIDMVVSRTSNDTITGSKTFSGTATFTGDAVMSHVDRVVTDPRLGYRLGITYGQALTSNGWPVAGTVMTVHQSATSAVQTLIQKPTGVAMFRAWDDSTTNWGPWVTPGGVSTTSLQTAVQDLQVMNYMGVF